MHKVTRRDFLKAAGVGVGLSLTENAFSLNRNLFEKNNSSNKYNVLFIVVDDLRPELMTYGADYIRSPNIDGLAKGGMVFSRTYCSVALCSPSRICVLTGARPETTGIYDLMTHHRKTMPNVITLPQLFKNNGYTTVGMGKIFHGELNDDDSWTKWLNISRDAYIDKSVLNKIARLKTEGKRKGLNGFNLQLYAAGPISECIDTPDNAYIDGALAEAGVSQIKSLSISKNPFFLAVGFKKPHLPFIAPKKYWDLYNEKDIKLAPNPSHPKDLPLDAVDRFPFELGLYSDVINLAEKLKTEGKTDFPADFAQKLKHGYFACVSYIDAQIGKLLNALKETGQDKHTIVILWGDNGFHLGENGTWGKHTNLERGTRCPMIIKAPEMKNPGKICEALTELVDIYPTLAELCDLEVPKHCEGTSYVLLMNNPNIKWKRGAFSHYQRVIKGMLCVGITLRADKYRYTEWRGKTTGNLVARELYDHINDSEENENIVNNEKYKAVVLEMKGLFDEGWKGCRPGLRSRFTF